jgi:hypothetical protein
VAASAAAVGASAGALVAAAAAVVGASAGALVAAGGVAVPPQALSSSISTIVRLDQRQNDVVRMCLSLAFGNYLEHEVTDVVAKMGALTSFHAK